MCVDMVVCKGVDRYCKGGVAIDMRKGGGGRVQTCCPTMKRLEAVEQR